MHVHRFRRCSGVRKAGSPWWRLPCRWPSLGLRSWPSSASCRRDFPCKSEKNREQSVINLDAAFLMDAIRNGTTGQSDLTNYINTVTISTTECDGKAHAPPRDRPFIRASQWGAASQWASPATSSDCFRPRNTCPSPRAFWFSTQNGCFQQFGDRPDAGDQQSGSGPGREPELEEFFVSSTGCRLM